MDFILGLARADLVYRPVIGEAIIHTKGENWPGAEADLEQFKQDWEQLDKISGQEEQAVNQALTDVEKALKARDKTLMINKLSNLSTALLAFDQMMHPVDLASQRKEFSAALTPALLSFDEVIAMKDEEKVSIAYKKLLSAWNKKERIVREQSLDYYGQIETQLGFLRIAVSKDAKKFDEIQRHFTQLSESIANFSAGKEAVSVQGNHYSLQTLVDLLNKAVKEIDQHRPQLAVDALEEFISAWPSVEGEILTRNGSLYTKLENNIPLIAGQLSSSNPDLESIQTRLKGYNQEIMLLREKDYTVWDAVLILLREGLEALLIVSALIAFLRKTNHASYQKWIWLGAFVGVVMSVIAAMAINTLFNTAMAGANREIIEGLTGIIAVLMMIGVGIWFHQKSHMLAWNRYINAQMSAALSTGSVITMALISFLSIFREGAETIIFYAAMAPSISTESLLIGIGIAVLILLVFTFLIIRYSTKIPIGPFFKAATFLIYALAFKILGVSLHALQLTNVISISQITNLPMIDLIGFFPTWETVLPQFTLLAIMLSTMVIIERRNKKQAAL